MTKLKELYWICGCVVEILLIVFLSLIFYLNEMEKAFTFNFDIYTSILLLIFIPLQLFLLKKYPYIKQQSILRTIIIILAIIVVIYSAISQISYALLDNNGNGKIPLFDPHDQNWYHIRTISRVIQYISTLLLICYEIYLWIKNNVIEIEVIDTFKQPLIYTEYDVINNNTNSLIDKNQLISQTLQSEIENTFEDKNSQALNQLKKQNSKQSSS